MKNRNEEKLRQLVRLLGKPDQILLLPAEERILEKAVSEFDIPLERARGIVLASADLDQIEIESDLQRMIAAMLAAFSGQQQAISYADFETVVKFHASKTMSPLETSRSVVKKLAERVSVTPQRSGFLLSTRWFRRIG